MTKIRALGLVLSILFLGGAANGQTVNESPVRLSAEPPAGPVRAGEQFEVHVTAQIDSNWHLYSATQPPGGPNATRFKLLSGEPFHLAEGIRQSKFTSRFDPNLGIETESFSNMANFWLPVRVAGSARAGEYELQLQVTFQACDDQVCLPPRKVPLPVRVSVLAAVASAVAPNPGDATLKPPPTGTITAGTQEQREPIPPRAEGVASPAGTSTILAGAQAEVQRARASGLFPYVWFSIAIPWRLLIPIRRQYTRLSRKLPLKRPGTVRQRSPGPVPEG